MRHLLFASAFALATYTSSALADSNIKQPDDHAPRKQISDAVGTKINDILQKKDDTVVNLEERRESMKK